MKAYKMANWINKEYVEEVRLKTHFQIWWFVLRLWPKRKVPKSQFIIVRRFIQINP